MILTVTLNPAIDKRFVVDRLLPGEVIRVKSVQNSAGGKGLNVARAAAIMGEAVTATGFLGGHNGDFVEESLRQEGIRAAFTKIVGETRCCINVFDESTGKQTELLEPGVSIDAMSLHSLLDHYDALLPGCDTVVLSGSAPPCLPDDIYATFIRKAHVSGAAIILDTSGTKLSAALAANPSLIKPNMEEMFALTGVTDIAGLPAAAGTLLERGAQRVVVSLGAKGALFVTRSGVWYASAPKLTPVNTTGCGDAMTAVFATAIHKDFSPPQLLRQAVAVASASALHPDTGRFDPQVAQRLFEEIIVTAIS
ncbi:MAG: 1-phosphofructokinase [Clostridium sp.]|jgi:tagatose 6-phosphate kinase|nr:1-phosphofructokinase [Clostridium sp.]